MPEVTTEAKIFACTQSKTLAEKIASQYGVPIGNVITSTYSDGEFQPSFEIITVDSTIIEFLIPVTILLTAVYNLKIAEQNTAANKQYGQYIATLFFGLIHGFGFSTYFKMIATGDQKVLPLVGFAAGIEVSQILVVLAVLGISFICQSVLKVSRRDWIIVASSIVIGVVLPILFKNWLW